MKKLLRNRGLVERGVLLESVCVCVCGGDWGGRGAGGGFQIVSSALLKKSMFSLLLEYIFLSGKYSHLM